MNIVIFSGHYDHIGVGKPVNGDSIFNGANDDAAGTTAVIMLAKYFAALKNNEGHLFLQRLPRKRWVDLDRNIFRKNLLRIK